MKQNKKEKVKKSVIKRRKEL